MLVTGGRISFLLVRGRGRRLLLHTSFRTRARVWVKVRDRSELRSGSVLDLRVIDLLVVDARVDMDEVNSHRVVSNWDLSRVVITDTTWDWA